MSTPETQKSWSSPDKSKRNTEREGGPVPPLHESVPSILPILATAIRRIGLEELDPRAWR
jgi:hypothetical protein